MSEHFSVDTVAALSSSQDDSSSVQTVQTKIKVVGTGSAVFNVLEMLIEQGLKGVEVIATDNEIDSLRKVKIPCKFVIDESRSLFEQWFEEIGINKDDNDDDEYEEDNNYNCNINDGFIKSLQESDVIIIVANLCSTVSKKLSLYIANITQELDVFTVAVVLRTYSYKKNLFQLAKNINSLIIIDSEISEKYAQEHHNKEVSNIDWDQIDLSCEAVAAISDSITANDNVNFNLDDLRATLCCYGYTAIECGRGRGADSVEEAVKDALSDSSLDLKAATGMMVVARVNPSFSTVKMTQLTDELHKYVCADIAFRTSIIFDDQYSEDTIVLTIFLSGFSISSLIMKESRSISFSSVSEEMDDSDINGHLLFGEAGVAAINVDEGELSAKTKTKIKVVAIGGIACNLIQDMINQGLDGVDFVAIDTDPRVLNKSNVAVKLLIEQRIENLPDYLNIKEHPANIRDYYADPYNARQAAEENRENIKKLLLGTQLVILVACMGEGAGSGASLVVADIAREIGVSTIAVMIRPLFFIGIRHRRNADNHMIQLSKRVDSMIVLDNRDFFKLFNAYNGPISTSVVSDFFLNTSELTFNVVNCIVNACSKVNYRILRSSVLRGSCNVSLCNGYSFIDKIDNVGMGIRKGKYFVEESLCAAFCSSPLARLEPKGTVGLSVDVCVNPQFQHSKWAQFFSDEIQKFINKDVSSEVNFIFDDQRAEDEILLRIQIKNALHFCGQHIEPCADAKATIYNTDALSIAAKYCNVFEVCLEGFPKISVDG